MYRVILGVLHLALCASLAACIAPATTPFETQDARVVDAGLDAGDGRVIDGVVDQAVVDAAPTPDRGRTPDSRGLDPDRGGADAELDEDAEAVADAGADAGPPPCVAGGCPEQSWCADSGHCMDAALPVSTTWAFHGDRRLHVLVVFEDPDSVIGSLSATAARRRIEPGYPEFGLWYRVSGVTVLYGILNVAEAPAQVDVYDDGELIWRVPVLPQAEKAIGERCTLRGGADRCERGALCLLASPDACHPLDDPLCLEVMTGACAAVDVRAWLTQSQMFGQAVTFELRADAFAFDRTAIDIRANGASISGRGNALGRSRRLGEVELPVRSPIEITQNWNTVVDALQVELPETLNDGACDLASVANVCAEPQACIAGTCAVPEPPVLEAAVVIKTADSFGIWVRGRDPDRNVVGARASPQGGGGAVVGTFGNPFPADAGDIEYDGEIFEAWYSSEPIWREVWEVALVTVEDDFGRSETLIVEPVDAAARPRGVQGDRCDPMGLILPCADGLFCDREDGGDDRLACRSAGALCAEPTRVLALDVPVQVEEAGRGALVTECIFAPDGLPGHTASFQAPEAGRYQVMVASSASTVIALRSSCRHPTTERDCVADRNPMNEPRATLLEVELAAGEEIGIIVIVPGTPFELSVMRLE